MTEKICVSILPKTNIEALNLIEKAEDAKADFIEIRLDSLETSRNLTDLTAHTKIPLIATNKLKTEGGNFSGTHNQRQETLLKAAKNGFQFIDLDLTDLKLKEQIREFADNGANTIVSYHKYDGPFTTKEMQRILNEQLNSGATICKIISTAKKIQDNLTVLNFVSENAVKTKLICFCMGEIGKTSRLLSPIFGAHFTFASLEKGSETAPGQISIKEMRTAYSLLRQKQ